MNVDGPSTVKVRGRRRAERAAARFDQAASTRATSSSSAEAESTWIRAGFDSVRIAAEGTRQLVRLRAVVKTLEDSYLAPLDGDTRAILHAALQQLAARDDAGC